MIGLEALIIAALWFGWSQAPKGLTVHVPPDLRSGATFTAGEVPPANVYAFAYYIFQQLNRWPEDGARDYGRAIFRVSPYLTPRYRAELIADLDLKGLSAFTGIEDIAVLQRSGIIYTYEKAVFNFLHCFSLIKLTLNFGQHEDECIKVKKGHRVAGP